MAKKYNGNVSFANGFKFTSAVPMDDRGVVATYQDLLTPATFKVNGVYTLYQGMSVTVAETGKTYTFLPAVANDANVVLAASWYTPSANAEAGVAEVSAQLATLIGDDASKSVRTIAYEEIAKQLIAEGAKESLDTLKEIADWIQKHPEDAADMSSKIETLMGDDATAGSLAKAIKDAKEALVGSSTDAWASGQKTITAVHNEVGNLKATTDDEIANLKGYDSDDENSESIAGAKKYADKAAQDAASGKVNGATGTTEGHVVLFGADGKTIKDSGFTIGKSVPSTAELTDTKVTAPQYHYTPEKDNGSTLSARPAETPSNVVTGVERDSKGHVTGLVTEQLGISDISGLTDKLAEYDWLEI